MKKVIVALLCLTVIVGAFAACANGGTENKEKKDSTTTTASQKADTTKTITTDDAKITDLDAINLIKSYSAKELGLTDKEYKDCSFLVSESGVKYKDNYYVSVIATIKTAHDDSKDENGEPVTTYTFDNKGVYYIRYDGKEILGKNGDGKFKKMEVKEVPTTTEAPTEETKKETTTKKK